MDHLHVMATGTEKTRQEVIHFTAIETVLFPHLRSLAQGHNVHDTRTKARPETAQNATVPESDLHGLPPCAIKATGFRETVHEAILATAEHRELPMLPRYGVTSRSILNKSATLGILLLYKCSTSGRHIFLQ